MEVKPGYQQSEMGVIPEQWQAKPLGQIAQLKNGYAFKSETYDSLGDFRVVTIANVQDGFMDTADCSRIASIPSDLQAHQQLCVGDILISMTGNVGRVCRVTEPGCLLNQRVGKLTPTDCDAALLFQLLSQRSFITSMATKAKGGAQGNLSVTDIIEFPFAMPANDAEQRAIAQALCDVDGLLDGLDRLIAKKRDLKQAAMQQLLTGQSRLPGFQCEWNIRPLSSEIADLEAGVSVNSVEGDSNADAGVPAVLKTSAVAGGVFIPSECKTIVPKDLERVKLSPRGESVIISRMNTIDLVGECGYVPKNFPNLFVPDRLWMTRFRSDSRVSARWLAYIFSTPASRRLIRNIATGTSGSMKNISKGAFLNLEFAFPHPDEQTAIAEILTEMDAELAALEERREKTRALKQAMMQELLTGKTRLVQTEAAHA